MKLPFLAPFLVVVALGCTPPAAEPAAPPVEVPAVVDVLASYRGKPVDLRPNLEPGSYLTAHVTSRAWGITRLDGMTTLDRDVTTETNRTIEVLETLEGLPTKARVGYVKDVERATITLEGEQPVTGEIQTPMHEAIEIQTLTDGKWRRELETGTPTMDQILLMRPAGAYFASVEAWSPAAVSVGDSWTVEGSDLNPLFGGAATREPEGKVTLKLVALKEQDGIPTAEIRVSGSVRASLFNSDDRQRPIEARFVVKETRVVNLATGVVIDTRISGTIESRGRLMINGAGLAGFTMSGNYEGARTIEVR
jgi:hypothetical protein